MVGGFAAQAACGSGYGRLSSAFRATLSAFLTGRLVQPAELFGRVDGAERLTSRQGFDHAVARLPDIRRPRLPAGHERLQRGIQVRKGRQFLGEDPPVLESHGATLGEYRRDRVCSVADEYQALAEPGSPGDVVHGVEVEAAVACTGRWRH